MRRHRKNTGYLRWVLRSVAASSALAVALLGLGAAPADAAATLFVEMTGAADPLAGLDVGLDSVPALGDLDGDGDVDLLAGERFGSVRYFENTGSATSPAFVERTGATNPLDGADVGIDPTVSLGDLDGDGDLDLVAGAVSGTLRYFENTGSATSPAFVARTGSLNPLEGEDVGYDSTPTLGDLDADGDLDLVAGESDGAFRYYQNTGSATAPAFLQRTGPMNPLDGTDVGGDSSPTLGDLDGDGDLDLVAGELYGTLRYFENAGSATSPAFVELTAWANPLDSVDVGYLSAPSLGDLDGDGDLELVAGGFDGVFHTFENLAGGFVERTGIANPLDAVGSVLRSAPSLGDLDGDGDLDLVLSDSGATSIFHFFENTGSAAGPAFVERTGAANPLDGESVADPTAPSLGDLDGDGDLDLVAESLSGSFHYFENTGSAASPDFVERTGAANPLDGVGVGGLAPPALGDLDSDGDLDLVAGFFYGSFLYFENTGSPTSPGFVERTGTANPLDGADVGDGSAPSLADVDGDGDLDLVSGELYGSVLYFENTGSATSPAFVGGPGAVAGNTSGTYSTPSLGDLDGDGDPDFLTGELGIPTQCLQGNCRISYFENATLRPSLSAVERTGAANPLDGESVAYRASPSLGDVDGDGDLDLVSGDAFGAFGYFENTGSATDAVFLERTGTLNPLAGEDVGYYSAPALGDLDADGDLDLIAGEISGSFRYFENTGSATSPAYVERTGAANPLDGNDAGASYALPALGDLDGDGDLDLVSGNSLGSFAYFENVGSATTPAYFEVSGFGNPLYGEDVGSWSTLALGDLDADGDLDLVAGEKYGVLHYFENTGSATDAAFLERTGTLNPLDGEDVGLHSNPSLGDLDADGDLDVVAGELYGAFHTYYLPEPAQGWLLGAGAALLGLLRRLPRERLR